MQLMYLIMFVWLSISRMVNTKPLIDPRMVRSLLRDNMSNGIAEKAEAIDNLLRLLSEIDLPSICDAISAQKTGGNEKLATVDAILAEAAKSQAMTFVPTNMPEAPAVTRPGNAPVRFADAGKIKKTVYKDGKQASQEVTISKSETRMDRLSLDIAAALAGNKPLKHHKLPKLPNNIDVTIATRNGILPNFPRRRFYKPKPHTTLPVTTPRPPKTTTTVTLIKKDTTIPTLASDLMLHEGIFESGDGENLIDGYTTEKYTTLKLEDESRAKKVVSPFAPTLKNIFKNRDESDYELQKESSKMEVSKQTKAPMNDNIPTSLYKTFFPDLNTEENELNEDTTTDVMPTAQEDLSWGFTLPTNTTFGEFMFGNITLNQNLSDELASILNSTVSLDYLIANDTIYNELMTILNDTLAQEETRKHNNSFDMTLNETSDYKNLINYISNMTEKLVTAAPATNKTDTSNLSLTEILNLNSNASLVIDSVGSHNESTEADSSTYSATLKDSEAVSTQLNSNNHFTNPMNSEYVNTKFPEYPRRRTDKTDTTISQQTNFVAGDYNVHEDQDKVNMLAGSNNLVIDHNDIKNHFKHSGFAPLNLNHDYKVNAKTSGLTYLGFDFKGMRRSPYTPKSENSAVASLTNQKTIFSEPAQRQVTFPAGYTCPGLFGYYGDAHDCKAFFICSWGVPYRFHCPPGTIWSSEESVCNWSRDVTCEEAQ